jgi:hypothetical protein
LLIPPLSHTRPKLILCQGPRTMFALPVRRHRLLTLHPSPSRRMCHLVRCRTVGCSLTASKRIIILITNELTRLGKAKGRILDRWSRCRERRGGRESSRHSTAAKSNACSPFLPLLDLLRICQLENLLTPLFHGFFVSPAHNKRIFEVGSVLAGTTLGDCPDYSDSIAARVYY